MTNLGQVAAIIERDTLPAGELKAIIRKVDGGGVFEDFFLWKDGAWRSFTTLFGAVHYSASAPSDTSKVWLDENFTPPLIKTYDAAAEEWKELSLFRSIAFDSDFTLQASHHNAALNVINTAGGDVTITVQDPGLDEFAVTISRLDATAVTLVPASGVELNGAAGAIGIASQWRSVLVRKYDTNKFLVEGNIL